MFSERIDVGGDQREFRRASCFSLRVQVSPRHASLCVLACHFFHAQFADAHKTPRLGHTRCRLRRAAAAPTGGAPAPCVQWGAQWVATDLGHFERRCCIARTSTWALVLLLLDPLSRCATHTCSVLFPLALLPLPPFAISASPLCPSLCGAHPPCPLFPPHPTSHHGGGHPLGDGRRRGQNRGGHHRYCRQGWRHHSLLPDVARASPAGARGGAHMSLYLGTSL